MPCWKRSKRTVRTKDIKLIIDKDLDRNKDIKNHLFFCIFRFGNSFINGNTIFDRICSIPFRIIMKLTYNKYNHIPLETNIGGVRIPHLLGIVLSGKASIGEQCTIMHQVTIGVDELKNNKAPVIGNNVFIGAGAKIIGNITVGNNVVIGAGAIVTKSVPDGKTVVGINRIIEWVKVKL